MFFVILSGAKSAESALTDWVFMGSMLGVPLCNIFCGDAIELKMHGNLSIIEFGNLSFPLNTHLCQNLFEKSKFENNILFIEGSIKSQNYE